MAKIGHEVTSTKHILKASNRIDQRENPKKRSQRSIPGYIGTRVERRTWS